MVTKHNMKNTTKLLALAGLLLLTIRAHAQQAEHRNGETFAVVYTEPNYQGWSYRILPGDDVSRFNQIQDGRWEFLANRISSIEIRGNMSVTLYDRTHHNGNSIEIRTSVRNLSRVSSDVTHIYNESDISQNNHHSYSWDNATLSFFAKYGSHRPPNRNPPPNHRPPPRRDWDVTFYRDSHFKSEYIGFTGNVQAPYLSEFHSDYGAWKNSISSIEIKSGYEVIIYEYRNLKGRSLTLTSSAQNLKNVRDSGSGKKWNNRISSFIIRKTSGGGHGHDDDNTPDKPVKKPKKPGSLE